MSIKIFVNLINDNNKKTYNMMKHLRYNRNLIEQQRKLSLNTVVLPPLSPTFLENEPEIIGNVWVNKTTNVNSGDVVGGGGGGSVGRKTDVGSQSVDIPKGSDSSRVAQLEQNVKFLQEQHQMMLAGLHNEIDSLRHRNRELQFQLVFAKGTLPSSPSSPEDDTKPKAYSTSPKNMTPLQVELLERELSELKIQMQEIESRNVYLSAIVDEQKKKLERYERDRERERERGIQPDPELLRKLDDAESLIRRLRRENSDLRRDQVSASSTNNSSTYHNQSYQNQRGGQQSSRGNQRHRGNGGNHYRGNWFPPLHTQFWQHGRAGGGSGGGVERNSGNGSGENTLPNLPSGSSGGGGNSSQYHGRRGANNNNHYHSNGDPRKYRGGQNRASKPT